MQQYEIYSSVSEDILPHEQNQIISSSKHLVLRCLQRNIGKFISARELAIRCGFPTSQTDVAVRKAITELIELDMKPIVSGAKGYMYAIDRSQLLEYAQQLESRRNGLQRRINAVMRIYRSVDLFESFKLFDFNEAEVART